MMLDATRGSVHRQILQCELEAMGIRLNKSAPDVYFRKRTGGGLAFSATVILSHIDEGVVRQVLAEYRIYHAELVVKQDITVDELIDAVLGDRKYLPCLYVYNKIDQMVVEELDVLAREPKTAVISCEQGLNLDHLLERIWDELSLLRIYTKRRGGPPDFGQPFVVRQGATVEHVCHCLHRSLPQVFKCALVWGASAKHQPQRVGLSHPMADEDVIQIFKKKGV